MRWRNLPLGYLALLALLLASALIALVTWFYPSIGVFILSNVAALFTLLVFGVLGGAFVGMVAAHRILSQSEFTPFEQTVIRALSDLREATVRLEKVESDLAERLDRLERERGGK